MGKPGGTPGAGGSVLAGGGSPCLWFLILSMSSLRSGRGRFMDCLPGVTELVWIPSGMFMLDPPAGAPDDDGAIFAENGLIAL